MSSSDSFRQNLHHCAVALADLNSCSCFTMYSGCCPARMGWPTAARAIGGMTAPHTCVEIAWPFAGSAGGGARVAASTGAPTGSQGQSGEGLHHGRRALVYGGCCGRKTGEFYNAA